MGGQDGFTRDLLNYGSESNSLLAGFKYQANDKWDLGLDFSWTQAEAALSPFELSAPEYEATHPTMSFDFSQTHTYSDLDSTRIDADAWLKYWFNKGLWLRFRYHYIDFQDDAPYLYDTSGTFQYIAGALGWVF
ncbi:MAG: MtrB/PioB family outer membrane beta-barrel protein [Acidobacteria bacterium]|nr:MtrB/PioB family outer membrane beta-barrel protein [Acidobacteriota bacterium]